MLSQLLVHLGTEIFIKLSDNTKISACYCNFLSHPTLILLEVPAHEYINNLLLKHHFELSKSIPQILYPN